LNDGRHQGYFPPMNYRHGFHAGNHADALKHAALALVLRALAAKEKPFEALDTHAGRGLYDLAGAEAARSPEWQGGIGLIIDDPAAPPSLAPWLDAVRAANPFGGLRWYPGSPLLIADALRAGDAAKFCELHVEERAALEAALPPRGAIRIFDRDGYHAVRAFLPPASRRGLVLIDPPFEQPGEYERLSGALADGLKRFATGVFMLWRPVKDAEGYRALIAALGASGAEKTLIAELRVRAAEPGKLTGSGLVIINPPFGLYESLAEALPYLSARLAIGPGAGYSLAAREGAKERRQDG
jgi:23S rRNA (adenine2030-N6)-methyltransferase